MAGFQGGACHNSALLLPFIFTMKKAILIASVFILLFVSVSAIEVESDEGYTWWGSFTHSLDKYGLFTAEGQSRQCSINADKVINPAPAGTVYTKAQLMAYCGSKPSFLVDVYTTGWSYLAEYRAESFDTLRINTAGDRILEIYCCPYKPCSSSADCSVAPASNYGSTCNTNYGSCYGTAPTHTTKVYKCVSGSWVYQYAVSSGSSFFCATSGQNNYMNSETSGGCYSSPPAGWCTSCVPSSACASNTCIGQTCSDGCGGNVQGTKTCSTQCASQGQSCGYSSSAPTCCSGLMCQNFGCYAPSNECTSGQTQACTIANGQGTKTCGSTGAWAACLVTSCNSGYTSQNNECVIPSSSDAETLTWSKYYSMSDEDFAEGNYYCNADSQCPTKEGYTIKCLDNEGISKRVYNYYNDKCDETLGWWDDIFELALRLGTLNLAKPDFCGSYADFKDKLSTNNDGVCVAESNSWYGGLWEEGLNVVASVGVPSSYVFLATILILLMLFYLIITMIK